MLEWAKAARRGPALRDHEEDLREAKPHVDEVIRFPGVIFQKYRDIGPLRFEADAETDVLDHENREIFELFWRELPQEHGNA